MVKISDGFKLDRVCQHEMEPLTRSKLIKTKMNNIKLMTLHPVDIVVTKIGRLNDRDIEDIETCINKFKLKKEDILQRVKEMDYVGSEESYQTNLGRVIKEYYS